MTKWYKKSFLYFALICFTSQVIAADLMEVYRQALINDPTFKAARADRLSKRENLPQTIAGVLPSLFLTGADASNISTTVAPQFRINNTTKFNSHNYLFTLNQPVFNFANWIKVRQASAIAKQADAAYAAAAQDLMLRVSKAYFAVLLAQDNLHFIRAQKQATWRQLDQAQQRYKVGLEAITTVYNAQASYDSIHAQEIAAMNSVTNAREELRQITGVFYPELCGLSKSLPLLNPSPNNIESWVQAAIQRNFTLLAACYAVDAARENVKVNYSNHLPTVAAVGTHQRSRQFTFGLGQNDTVNDSIGLQLTLPIYQGGLISSQSRQAQYDYEKASADRENVYYNTVVSTRQNFNDINSGISKIRADQQAVLSNQSSLSSTNEAFKVGTRTIVDVLLAQQNLFQAYLNHSTDQYTYLISTITLKLFVGTLNETDLRLINSWLTTPYSQTEKYGEPARLDSFGLEDNTTSAQATKPSKPKLAHHHAKKNVKLAVGRKLNKV